MALLLLDDGSTTPDAAADWLFDPAELARRVCDRHFGVGADGLLVYGPRPPRTEMPRIRMLYWNADGSRAEMCGNGARCVVRLAYDRGETAASLRLETDAGARPARVVVDAAEVTGVELDMGEPIWVATAVPVRAAIELVDSRLRVGTADLAVTAVSMGNPHAVVLVEDRAALERVPLEVQGRALAEHAVFPAGANASFVAVVNGELYLRVWERGVGATLACGTATCAAYAVARRLDRLQAERVRVHVPGGVVEVWRAADGHLWLGGPAAYVAEGTLAAELLAPPANRPDSTS